MIDALELCELAQVAEEVGFDGIAMPDSVFYPEQVSAPYPYTADGKRMWAPETPMPDPFIAMAAMAAVTSRIQFYTNVFKLPLRDPLLTAKQIATMAVMSRNRVALGVGFVLDSRGIHLHRYRDAHPAVRVPTKPSRSSRRCVRDVGRNGSNTTASTTISTL